MLELKIYNPTTDKFIKEIEFNFDDIKNELISKVEMYNSLTYTDDQIKEAKSDRANLNKFIATIEDKRKIVKKLILEPYNNFEAKIKELVSLVNKPIDAIDTQIKAVENKAKELKQNQIELIYDENIGNLKEVLPLESIFNPKWLNATVTIKSAEADLKSIIDTVKKDLSVIDTLDSEFKLQVKDYYLRTRDLSGALAEKARLEDQKKKIEAVEKKPDAVISEPTIEPEKSEVDSLDWANVSEKPKETSIKITCNDAQLQLLKVFLDMHKIKFEEVK